MFAPRAFIALLSFLILLYIEPITAKVHKRGVPSDVPYIICETCSHLAKQSVTLINEVRSDALTKLTQIKTLDIVESLCTSSTEPGRWARQIDLVERDDQLRLIPQEGVQECAVECGTLVLACGDILDGLESELADRLYVLSKKGNVNLSEVEEWLCAKGSGVSRACDRRVRPLPANREQGPPFVAKEKKALAMESLIEELNKGDGGKPDLGMFTRDELMKGLGNMDGKDNTDDDDDEDDDEDKGAEKESNDTVAAMNEVEVGEFDGGVDSPAAGGKDANPIGSVDGGSDEL